MLAASWGLKIIFRHSPRTRSYIGDLRIRLRLWNVWVESETHGLFPKIVLVVQPLACISVKTPAPNGSRAAPGCCGMVPVEHVGIGFGLYGTHDG